MRCWMLSTRTPQWQQLVPVMMLLVQAASSCIQGNERQWAIGYFAVARVPGLRLNHLVMTLCFSMGHMAKLSLKMSGGSLDPL